MKNHKAAFAERLRKGLEAQGIDTRPVELVKVLARYGKVVVTQQAISHWFKGRYWPKQDALIALARLAGMAPHELRYGRELTSEVREPRLVWPDELKGLDRLLFEEILALPSAQREMVRQFVGTLSRSTKVSSQGG